MFLPGLGFGVHWIVPVKARHQHQAEKYSAKPRHATSFHPSRVPAPAPAQKQRPGYLAARPSDRCLSSVASLLPRSLSAARARLITDRGEFCRGSLKKRRSFYAAMQSGPALVRRVKLLSLESGFANHHAPDFAFTRIITIHTLGLILQPSTPSQPQHTQHEVNHRRWRQSNGNPQQQARTAQTRRD